jgi:serine/threonine protein kinase
MYKTKKKKKQFQSKKPIQIQTKKQKNRLKSIGGKMLASGGFGCVFRPALKCVGHTNREKNKVSKLMTTKHAYEELNEIKNMKNKLKDIPNYQNYFLVDNFSVCKPEKLEKEDLKNFEKCHALSRKTSKINTNSNTHYTISDVNNNLSELKILNMPFGGLPVDDFIQKNKQNIDLMYDLNNKLLDLLKNGIVPLNNHHIYHNDIKDSNVLVKSDKQHMKTRLIDWGLSCSYNPTDEIPKSWENRPFQFNVPFSVILFTDTFKKSFEEFADNSSFEQNRINTFVKTYISVWKEKRGNGHMSYINHIFKLIKKENQAEIYIVNYIAYIVESILKKNMTLKDYLNNVFIKIIDIWGFITLYVPLLELLHDNLDNLVDAEINMYEVLKNVFMKYLYHPRITKINTDELEKDLQQISVLIKKLKNNVIL